MPRLIDADDAIQFARKNLSNTSFVETFMVGFLAECPTIDAVPVVHGEWEILEEHNIVDTRGNPSKYAKCTNCGFRWNDLYSVGKYFKNCPNCTAKMEV